MHFSIDCCQWQDWDPPHDVPGLDVSVSWPNLCTSFGTHSFYPKMQLWSSHHWRTWGRIVPQAYQRVRRRPCSHGRGRVNKQLTNADTTYYSPGIDPDNRDPPKPQPEWEHRKITGLIWENRAGWRLETKLCSDLTGPSDHYRVDPSMITMIKESNRNRRLLFRSDMWWQDQTCRYIVLIQVISITFLWYIIFLYGCLHKSFFLFNFHKRSFFLFNFH